MNFSKKHVKIWRRLKLIRQRQKDVSRKFAVLQCREDFRNMDTFHSAMRPCLLFGQIFGLMPLINSQAYNPYRLMFKIPCLTFTTSLYFFVFGGMKIVHFSAMMFMSGINAKNIIGIVFFYMVLAIFLNFLNLARRWPQLIQHWTRIDLLFLMPPYRPPKWSLRKQLRTLTLTFWIIALVENFLYHSSQYYSYRKRRQQCYPENPRDTYKDFLIFDQLTDAVSYFPPNMVVIICTLFLNATFSVMWNFMDFFIIALSLGLATRFRQFADRIQLLDGCYAPDALWNQIRRHHIILCEFMEVVNEHMSTIVFMSSLNNMYFICNNLLNIFTKLRYTINYIYFWFSLIFLLSRTACVFMFASEIHDASLLPLKTLHLVPSGCWTEEVQRFIAQILNETIGLTGRNFYLVTRKGLFGMMATIITYEFMLLQFDAKSPLPDICA